jgi:hypothetical protein
MLWAFAGQVVARWLAETAKCDPHHPSWGPRKVLRFDDARFRYHLDGAPQQGGCTPRINLIQRRQLGSDM